MTTPAEPRILADAPALSEAVQISLRRTGFAVVRSPDLCRRLREEPPQALAALVGEAPVRHACVDVAPVAGRASIVESDRDGRLHVDAFPFASPDLVVMSCDQQAASGGETVLVDTRPVLAAIAEDDPELYAALFLRYREFRFPAYHVHAPTFSLRNHRLTCHHATFPRPGDTIGARFQAAVDRAPRFGFRLAAGDLYVIDNHRVLHGRSRFSGPRRLQRLQAWMPAATPAAAGLLDAAAIARAWHDELAAALPVPMRRRLGLEPLAATDLPRIPSRALDAALSAFVAGLPAAPAALVERLLATVRDGVAA